MLKKTTLWLLSVMMLLMMLVAGCGGGEEKKAANDSQKLIVYTSMKESLIKGIVDGFKKANPGIDVDYQSAGAGKLMAKIAAERQSGKILADVIWTSEVPDFYNMKNEGARLGTLGIVINTDKIKTAPTQWSDLMKPDFKDRFGIANPALSGTSYMSVALLEKQFGWKFFEDIKANGGRIGKGSGQVIDDTASGELSAALAVDYITNAKAKKFVDYLLSKEAQTLVAQQGTIPVREDVEIPAKFNLPAPKEALEKSIKIDYIEAIKTKEDTIKKFSDIMQMKQ